MLYNGEKSALAVRKGTVVGYTCNTNATRKEGAVAPSVLLPFLIRYELSHKSLDSLSLAYPSAVTRPRVRGKLKYSDRSAAGLGITPACFSTGKYRAELPLPVSHSHARNTLPESRPPRHPAAHESVGPWGYPSDVPSSFLLPFCLLSLVVFFPCLPHSGLLDTPKCVRYHVRIRRHRYAEHKYYQLQKEYL